MKSRPDHRGPHNNTQHATEAAAAKAPLAANKRQVRVERAQNIGHEPKRRSPISPE